MKNHSFIFGIAFLFTALAYSAESQILYSSREACFQKYSLDSKSNDPIAAEAFCKDKYARTAIDDCADQKLTQYKMNQSLSLVEEPKYRYNFINQCIKEKSVAAQQAATAQKYAAAPAVPAAGQQQASGAKSGGGFNAAEAYAVTRAGIDITDKGTKIYDKYKEKQAAAEKAKAAQPTDAAKPAAKPTPSGTEGSQAIAGTQVMKGSDGKDYTVTTAADGKVTVTDPSGATIDKVPGAATDISAGAAAQKQVSAAAKDAGTEVPPAKDTIQAGADAAENTTSKTSGAPTDITAAEQKLTQETSQAITSGINSQIQVLQRPGPALAFTQTVRSIEDLWKEWKEYTDLKKTCTQLAETSGFLCIEGTSPGQQTAKEIIDVAGPVIAGMNSIQKSCSSTAKVTRVAGLALTAAKGVCVAAQLSCEGGCKLAAMKLASINEKLEVIRSSIGPDAEAAYSACLATDVNCINDATNTKASTAGETYNKLAAAIQKESPPTPGTVAYNQSKCNANIKDALLLGMNILGSMAAQQSAEDCEKKVAADGGGNVTPAQYCDTPANQSTTICKCQKDNSQMGCSGYVSKDTADKTVGNVAKSQSMGGLSSFASGAKISTKGSGSELDKALGGGGDSEGSGSGLSLGGDSSGGSPTGSGGGSASSSQGFGNGGSGANADAGKEKEKSNWSFGGFTKALSSMFSKGNSKGSKQNGNGNASFQKTQDAVKRRIASERVAAEVTSASGKSNWEKVHRAYVINETNLPPQQ